MATLTDKIAAIEAAESVLAGAETALTSATDAVATAQANQATAQSAQTSAAQGAIAAANTLLTKGAPDDEVLAPNQIVTVQAHGIAYANINGDVVRMVWVNPPTASVTTIQPQ